MAFGSGWADQGEVDKGAGVARHCTSGTIAESPGCDTARDPIAPQRSLSCPPPNPVPSTLGALDLAALLCSRVCHDLISPVGAIVNGLEVLEEDKDEETKTFALDLIKKSAQQASAKLQFCRLAFGAAGSAGAQIELGDAEKVARGLHRGRQDQDHLEPAPRTGGRKTA